MFYLEQVLHCGCFTSPACVNCVYVLHSVGTYSSLVVVVVVFYYIMCQFTVVGRGVYFPPFYLTFLISGVFLSLSLYRQILHL